MEHVVIVTKAGMYFSDFAETRSTMYPEIKPVKPNPTDPHSRCLPYSSWFSKMFTVLHVRCKILSAIAIPTTSKQTASLMELTTLNPIVATDINIMKAQKVSVL
jgi:hypothetical protein